jgi:hypothetical protein
MTHYRLRVYSDAGYFPDKAVKSVMRRRVERRALRLEDEGFKTKLVAAPSTVRGPARVTAPRRRKTAPERRRRRCLKSSRSNESVRPVVARSSWRAAWTSRPHQRSKK